MFSIDFDAKIDFSFDSTEQFSVYLTEIVVELWFFEEILYYSFPNIRLNYLFYEEDAFIFLLFK